MDYILSEEELIDLLDDNITNACQSPIDLAKAILQDLPTVELVAEGKISDTKTTKNTLEFIFESGGYDFVNFPYGNNIKIYIVKEGK